MSAVKQLPDLKVSSAGKGVHKGRRLIWKGCFGTAPRRIREILMSFFHLGRSGLVNRAIVYGIASPVHASGQYFPYGSAPAVLKTLPRRSRAPAQQPLGVP